MRFKYLLLFVVFSLFACETPMIRMVDEFYENGNPKSVNYYSSIEKKQKLKTELFYKNGALKMSGYFRNNQKHGQWLYYYENGFIADEAWFLNGKLHGRSSSSYKNGVLRSNGYYEHGKKIREWTYFDESGKLKKKVYHSR